VNGRLCSDWRGVLYDDHRMDDELQLTDAHFIVLNAIADYPGSTPADIAQRLGLTVDDVLRLLGDLDAAGMVTPGHSH
jgi:DNA-binding MarR family transcriptional regulator